MPAERVRGVPPLLALGSGSHRLPADAAGHGDVRLSGLHAGVGRRSDRGPMRRPRAIAARPTTKTRVDLGLRIDGAEPGGRLLDGRTIAGGTVNIRGALSAVDDLDDEAVGVLRRAYDANSLGSEICAVAPGAKTRPGIRHPD